MLICGRSVDLTACGIFGFGMILGLPRCPLSFQSPSNTAFASIPTLYIS